MRIPLPILLALATGADAWGWVTTSEVFLAGKVRRLPGTGPRQQGTTGAWHRPRVGLAEGAAITVKWYREAGWLTGSP
jgi:hypothetical protein